MLTSSLAFIYLPLHYIIFAQIAIIFAQKSDFFESLPYIDQYEPGRSNWAIAPRNFQIHVWLLGTTTYNHFARPHRKYQLVAP